MNLSDTKISMENAALRWKTRLGLLFAVLLSAGHAAWGQDPVFSQFYAAPTLMNPAFAGTTNAPRININYRNQWSSLSNAYETFAFAYDQHFESLRSGLGFSVLTDQAGDGIYNTTQFNFIYAYRIPINEDTYIKGGMQLGMHQVALDWDRLVFLDQIDPVDGSAGLSEEDRPSSLTQRSADVSAGLLLYGKKFYGGLSIFHINNPEQSVLDANPNLTGGLPSRLNLHGGMQFSLLPNNNRGPSAFISPNVMYTRQRDFQQLNVGTYASYGLFYSGVWYRHAFGNPDATIFLVGVSKGILKVGYSYDLTISELRTESNGSHEISLMLNFDRGRKRPIDYNDCLELFR